ncbi:MAG: hypothetical protein INH41_19015 [Myxococcaceae bacterium]|nr:hypothetical protein [Myxococcaceae bacterium]MCA3014478.1 hypothetical protein [Myxococcaceae bacterium]
MVSLLCLCLGQLTPPPLVPGDAPLQVSPAPTPAQPEPAGPTSALHFSPVSLFATHLSFELERVVSPSVSFFGSIGGSLLLQAGVELGARLYVGARALEGPFLGLQGTAFYFSQGSVLLVGPAGTFGYAFFPKDRRVVLTFGAGLQVWHQPLPDSGLSPFLGTATQADVLFLPGLQRPGAQRWAAQPMIRFTVGPAF